jgi:thiol-disulfide isomerase/thioredoxin
MTSSKVRLLALFAAAAIFAAGCPKAEEETDAVSSADAASVPAKPASQKPEATGTPSYLQPAPNFTIKTLESGESLSLASLKGNVVLIDFWATWCPPCIEGLPITQAVYDKYKDKGLKVIAVSDEDKDTVKKFIDENKYTFPTYLDPEQSAFGAFEIRGIPTMVVIDREGRLVEKSVGLHPQSDIERMLAAAGI